MVTDKISSVTIDLTEQCNLRCTYCFTSGKTNREMSFETAKDTIDWLVKPETNGDAKSVHVTFWGGEPLLKFDLMKQIVEYGEEVTERTGIKITWGMTTNLTLCTPEVCKWLKENKVGVLFSVDGTRENHNKYRPLANGKGSYDLVEAGIDNAKAAGLPVCLRFTLAPDTIKDLYNDIKWYIDNKGIYAFHFSPAYELDWNDEAYEVLEEQFGLLVDEVTRQLENGKVLRIKPFVFKVTNLLLTKPDLERNPCGAGCNYVGVAVDGAIYPCHRFHDFCDFRPWQEQEKCIGSIYEGITRPEFREEFLKYQDKIKEGPCAECELYRDKLCFGGCYAANIDNTGSIYACPEAECVVEKMQVKYSKILLERHGADRKFLSAYYENRGGGKCRCNSACYANGSCECYMGCYNDVMPVLTRNEKEREEEINRILEKAKEVIASGADLANDIAAFVVDTALGKGK